ncbi:carbonic anhydrase [uncultured Sphingomonas sp.]|uniref:carbonic anhydrase n=1 Tax=uncultured Sphingomonas sp. TaxID=158754 RepID=UPI0035CB2632
MTRPPLLLAAALAACAIGAAARSQVGDAPPTTAESPRREWGYTGPTGPEHWAELSQEYGVCARGQQESPIDLKSAIGADLGALTTHWRSLPLRVVDTGHALQVDAPPGSDMSVGGRSYALAQFHVHHPSEHLLNGRRFPLEVHFVHRGPNGVLGVIGVFVEEGRANPQLQRVLDARPAEHGRTRAVAGGTVDIAALMPGGAFERYEGSLTTPPCSESVDWVVKETPIQASAAQIAGFERVYPFNARPLQALNRRFLLRSR